MHAAPLLSGDTTLKFDWAAKRLSKSLIMQSQRSSMFIRDQSVTSKLAEFVMLLTTAERLYLQFLIMQSPIYFVMTRNNMCLSPESIVKLPVNGSRLGLLAEMLYQYREEQSATHPSWRCEFPDQDGWFLWIDINR